MVVHMTPVVFRPVEAFSTQLTIVRPQRVRSFPVHIQINPRPALIQTIGNVTL
jgi:hypothetical protein